MSDDECPDRFIFEDDLVSDYLNLGRHVASLRNVHEYEERLSELDFMQYAEFSREPPDGDAAFHGHYHQGGPHPRLQHRLLVLLATANPSIARAFSLSVTP